MRQIADCRLQIADCNPLLEGGDSAPKAQMGWSLWRPCCNGCPPWETRSGAFATTVLRRHFANSFETMEQQPKRNCGSRFDIDNFLGRNFGVNKALVATLSTLLPGMSLSCRT